LMLYCLPQQFPQHQFLRNRPPSASLSTTSSFHSVPGVPDFPRSITRDFVRNTASESRNIRLNLRCSTGFQPPPLARVVGKKAGRHYPGAADPIDYTPDLRDDVWRANIRMAGANSAHQGFRQIQTPGCSEKWPQVFLCPRLGIPKYFKIFRRSPYSPNHGRGLPPPIPLLHCPRGFLRRGAICAWALAPPTFHLSFSWAAASGHSFRRPQLYRPGPSCCAWALASSSARCSRRSAWRWEKMFKRLLAYKAETGDCNVPDDYSDKQFSKWVQHRRGDYKNCTPRTGVCQAPERGWVCVGPPWGHGRLVTRING
jgi:hypothetical protein